MSLLLNIESSYQSSDLVGIAGEMGIDWSMIDKIKSNDVTRW